MKHGIGISLAALLLAGPVLGSEDAAEATAHPVAEPASDLLVLGAAGAVAPESLDGERAMAKIQVDYLELIDQELNGTVNGNVAINTHSGDNVIADGAFVNGSGFISAIQNTGNNVLIQNATIINVDVAP